MGMDANLFTEGAIYWYENTTNTKKDYENSNLNQDFLVSRPIYILRSNKTTFDEFTINVLVITSSQKRIGIPINIDGIRNGKILPYNIRSVHTKYLTKYMGHVSKDIMDEVNQSILYHLAFTDKKPKYLDEYETAELTKQKYVNELTPRELTVFEFINKKCLFRNNYYSDTTELFQLYCKCYTKDGYSRLRDFNIALSKILKVFPDVEIKEEHKKKILVGLSINGNVHKLDQPEATFEQINHKKNLYDENVVNIECMSRDELIEYLDDKSRKEYYRLDIVQKIDNYNRNVRRLNIDNISEKDIYAIHKLIKQDVDEKKKKVFHMLEAHANPLNMNTVNQFVLFICTDDEILSHTDDRYLKKGGLYKLRKELKNNVHHYFIKRNG